MHRKALRRARALFVALSLGLVAPVVGAQSAATGTEEEANAAIARGVALRQGGNDDEALAAFRQADQIFPSPRAKAQIALAEQALGQWVAAERDLRLALSAENDPWIQRNREPLAAALTQIASRLGSLEVRCAVAGAELFINEERVASLPLAEPVRVPVGTISIEVRAAGHSSQRRAVEVTSGARLREVFTLVAARASGTGDGPDNGSNNGSNNGAGGSNGRANGGRDGGEARAAGVPVGPIVVLGAGAVSLGLAGVFAGLRGGAMSACRYVAASDTLECATTADANRARAGAGFTTGLNVTLIGGALLVAGGGAWLVASLLTRPRPNEQARVAVVPMVFANGAAIAVGGRF